MRPVLFRAELFGFELSPSSYAVLYVLAFLAGAALVLAPRASRRELGPFAHEIALVLVLGGFLVSRLTKPVVYAGTGATTGGTYFFGWALGSAALLFAYARWRSLDAARLFDALAPAVLLGSAIGRIGCLLAGCCRGIACAPPWGVELAGRAGTYFPAQLVNALGDALALALLLAFVRPRVRRSGRLAIAAIWLYVAFRFPVEWLRAEPAVLLGLTQGQLLGAALLPLTAVLWWRRGRVPAAATS